MSRFPLRPALLGAILLASVALPARAQTFPFALPWDDSSASATNVGNLNPAPITNLQRVTVKNGHFADATGRRVRFLGTNIVASAAFTRPEDAAAVAARLHKYGFNIVRMHHMDASWSNPSVFGADHDARKGPNQIVDPDSLELLDNFVAELKKQGVYTNLNLHVARSPSTGDGFPDADKLPEMGKVTAYFEPKFIALQKDYARQILDHKNPHTGMRWADDPAIAVVELNNEDTLIGHAWDGSLQAMPKYYRDTLMSGWNTFLRARYQSDAALKNAWQGEPIGDNIARDAALDEGDAQWSLSKQGEAQGTLETVAVEGEAGVNKALKVSIEKQPTYDWQMEVMQTKLSLREGQYYTASLRARAEAPRIITVGVGINRAPWTRYGSATLQLTPQWQKFQFIFRAGGDTPNANRITFGIGGASDTVYLSDVQIRPGALAEIGPDWSLQKANFDLPGTSVVAAQAQDWTDYLAAIEQSYVDTMTDYIKKDLGYKGLVTGSQASYGGWAGVARESRTDWIDMHAYWQHPNFPGKAWDSNNWNIPNTPMTDAANTGTLLSLATHRVAGKPFTVSEYNHAAPNDYASETVPLILGYAAAQDWDGVYLFDYNGNRDNWKTDKIEGYFSVHSDPNKMAMLPGMARAFLRGDIAAFKGTTTLTVPRGELLKMTAQKRSANVYDGMVAGDWKRWGLTRDDLLNSRVQLKLASTDGEPTIERSGPRGGQWSWNFRGDRGVIAVDAPAAKALVGRIGDSFVVGPLQEGALRVSDVESPNQWAALTLVSLDKLPVAQSKSLLLTALNRAENTGMEWNADRTSVGDKWGEGPTQLAVPHARISLATKAKRARVFRLTPTGDRGAIASSSLKDGVLSFEIGPDDQTVWWQIVTE